MKSSTKKILIVAGVAGAAGLAWWWFTQNQAGVATTPPAGSAAVELPTGTMSSTLATPSVITVPTAAAQPIAAIDPVVLAAVQAWGESDGRAPVMLMIDAEVPSEYEGMYNIIANNLWGTAGVLPFWNALRNKYDAMTIPAGNW